MNVHRVLISICVTSSIACSSPDDTASGDETLHVARPSLTLSAACTDSSDAVYMPVTGLAKYNATRRGEVVRCAFDRNLSRDELTTALEDAGYADVTVKSSVRVYRVAYRTDRLLGEEGLTTALLLLPDRPIAEHPPTLVVAHGFNGLADACRQSRLFAVETKEMVWLLALSGYGYPVIAPDYAGWAAGSPTTALVSEDEAHSVLDGTRAMRNLLAPGGTSDQVVLVGHSQGGHAVLSAQALAASYGLAGHLAAVVPFAPSWYPARIVGAVISSAAGYTTAEDSSVISLAMVYLQGHAELYDGPGSAGLLYQPSKRDAVARFFDPSLPCHASSAEGPQVIKDALVSMGATTSDFFEPAFLDSVGPCGVAGGAACATEPAATWSKRFRADRPALDPHGAEVLFWQGAEDQSVDPSLAQCGIDKITSDLSVAGATARFTVCGDRAADHQTVRSNNLTWTAQWIASRTLGTPEPEACPGIEALQPAGGEPIACPAVPGNAD
jgi:pimeloyl-ACP methyl ester carboxylesterase